MIQMTPNGDRDELRRYPLLSRISSPGDLSTLTSAELVGLAQEIRAYLIASVAKTGGHLGPNLGIVEVALAVHRIFESPRDTIIWDTGHQAYVHKMLTGRKDFSNLRREGGLSGYPSRAESVHDVVENSHATTALSWANGVALEKKRMHIPGATVAVIGCGGVGLSVISGAVLAGAGRIIAIDRLDSKLDIARQLGATDVINATSVDPVGEVMEMTGGGVHFAFEALGLKETAKQTFNMLRMGGTATLIGMFKPGQALEFEGSMFIKDRKVQGSSMGSNQFRVDIPNLLNFYRQGRLNLDHLISSRLELEKINEGFANLQGGAPVRQLIDFHVDGAA